MPHSLWTACFYTVDIHSLFRVEYPSIQNLLLQSDLTALHVYGKPFWDHFADFMDKFHHFLLHGFGVFSLKISLQLTYCHILLLAFVVGQSHKRSLQTYGA